MYAKEEQEYQDEDFQNAFFIGTEHNTDPQTARSDGDLWHEAIVSEYRSITRKKV
jgi:hypothetical protein